VNILQQARDRAVTKAGGHAAMARAIGLYWCKRGDCDRGLTRQAVRDWVRIPDHHVVAVSEITGIPKRELRPDRDFQGQ